MSLPKRILLFLYVLIASLTLAVLALSWYGPWVEYASWIMADTGYSYVISLGVLISAFGLFVLLMRSLFHRRVKVVELQKLEGGRITVTRDAMASQASHIVELSGWCHPQRVFVDIRNKNRVNISVRVRPLLGYNISTYGQELYNELHAGLSQMCGSALNKLTLRFLEAREDTGREYHEENQNLASVYEETQVNVASEALEQSNSVDSDPHYVAYPAKGSANAPQNTSESGLNHPDTSGDIHISVAKRTHQGRE